MSFYIQLNIKSNEKRKIFFNFYRISKKSNQLKLK